MELDPLDRSFDQSRDQKARSGIVRAFTEFLNIPALIVAGSLMLAVITYVLDRTDILWLAPLEDLMTEYVFGSPQSTAALVGTVAAGIITITSITFSLLLLAVQQAASSMTPQIIDQFLRRQFNRVVFGFFIGVAIYALVILATINPPFNPVFSASVVLLSSFVALLLLPLLIYKTIDQVRPNVILNAIHDLILAARERQLELIGKTSRSVHRPGIYQLPVRVIDHGFIVNIDIDAILQAADNADDEIAVEIRVAIGTYTAHHDTLAIVHAVSPEDARAVAPAVARAFRIEQQRNLNVDAAYGLKELETIAWTSISTSKQNPAPGLAVTHNLRDILVRWAAEHTDERSYESTNSVVYYHDDVPDRLMDAFESILVVSTESMQYQNYVEVLHAFAISFDRLPPAQQRRATDVILRSLSGLADQILTSTLDAALEEMVGTLQSTGFIAEARVLCVALDTFRQSRGQLHARGSRTPTNS